MSYRAFKRLLGETSLERKCRFLFGAGILVLITLSFWFYAIQTESLAYDQAKTTCRLLVNPSLYKEHLPYLTAEKYKDMPGTYLAAALNAADASKKVFGEGGEYQYALLKENYTDLNPFERELFRKFNNEEAPKDEAQRYVTSGHPVLIYYSGMRATKECLKCHDQLAKMRKQPKINEGDLMAIMRITMRTDAISNAVHINRAILIATALVTALLIMAGSWLIVRYVIVKPVKHLKDVSDAISAGELNVRSEIQTGDEFEDLSHAFNRMLRNLVSMQDRLRKVNSDLDRKVDELAQANMALFESNKLKNDFLATMSHELRTPLNSILGFSDVLLSKDRLADKQKRWVGNIKSSGERLLNLINDILDLARIEAGKMQVRLEEFSIHDVCEGQLNMFRPLAEKKNIDLRSQIAPDVPLMRQDVTKIQQILQNLLSNAIKFTPEGGRVLLKARKDDSFLQLIIQDTGVGIAPEEQELVFEKFRQSGNPLTREQGGTGLGLSIVRELSKLLGGEVTLESELGRGSTFTVRVPLHLSAETRLEFDVADQHIDLSKAQRIDVHTFAATGTSTPVTRVDSKAPTRIDLPDEPEEDKPAVEGPPYSPPEKNAG